MEMHRKENKRRKLVEETSKGSCRDFFCARSFLHKFTVNIVSMGVYKDEKKGKLKVKTKLTMETRCTKVYSQDRIIGEAQG